MEEVAARQMSQVDEDSLRDWLDLALDRGSTMRYLLTSLPSAASEGEESDEHLFPAVGIRVDARSTKGTQ